MLQLGDLKNIAVGNEGRLRKEYRKITKKN